MPKLTPPKDLQGPGRALWRSILEDYDLSKPELALLREACRTSDELEVLRSTVLAAEVVTEGSTGQPVIHRGYDELRRHREALTKLLAAMDMPVEVVPVVPKLAAAPPGRAVQSSLARARARAAR
jgi:hypothetical protein